MMAKLHQAEWVVLPRWCTLQVSLEDLWKSLCRCDLVRINLLDLINTGGNSQRLQPYNFEIVLNRSICFWIFHHQQYTSIFSYQKLDKLFLFQHSKEMTE